ncbi:MAG: DUF2764 domain-containing protein [Mediterranea sp.]|jgi:hypothetical protein|nr:DUF2764 domain-containing protein [Mediterranea sp.]
MSNYYYLIAGLPDLTLEDSKLSYTVSGFREGDIYPSLSDADKRLIDLFYLKFDHANVLKLLKNKDAEIDTRGNFSAVELAEYIAAIKEGGAVNPKEFPSYLVTFITNYFSDMPAGDDPELPENGLAALYYAYGMESKNRFVASWFEFNLILNNVFAALTARKYKTEVSRNIVGDTAITETLRTSGARDFGLTGEVTYFDQLVKISEIDELLEREKKIDRLKWNWIEDEIFFHYFSVERIFAFLLKIEMIERWLSLDKERGKEMFRELIGSLKDDVRIPAEFK